jgi:hypothetical protein
MLLPVVNDTQQHPSGLRATSTQHVAVSPHRGSSGELGIIPRRGVNQPHTEDHNSGRQQQGAHVG